MVSERSLGGLNGTWAQNRKRTEVWQEQINEAQIGADGQRIIPVTRPLV
jgi:hypothetical protein